MNWKTAIYELRLADILLIALVLTSIVLSARYYSSPRQRKSVYVYKANNLFGVYPLSENRVIKIDEHNTIQIKDSQVRMLKADCPDKRCINQGYCDAMPIICLPNQLLIEIKSSETEKKFILH